MALCGVSVIVTIVVVCAVSQVANAAKICHPGYEKYEDHCYKFVNQSETHAGAVTACNASVGESLIAYTSVKKIYKVGAYVVAKKSPATLKFWTAPTKRRHASKGKCLAAVRKTGKKFIKKKSLVCTNKLPYVCEGPTHAPPTTAPTVQQNGETRCMQAVNPGKVPPFQDMNAISASYMSRRRKKLPVIRKARKEECLAVLKLYRGTTYGMLALKLTSDDLPYWCIVLPTMPKTTTGWKRCDVPCTVYKKTC
ncbi:uncharacterized protein LOC135494858 [Lineus longissimus]|uniref:uncharacterized protein LOC135494858 n=1 Tax=Lineus longissimus TaxID=88925 RepID=UPI002B4F34D6